MVADDSERSTGFHPGCQPFRPLLGARKTAADRRGVSRCAHPQSAVGHGKRLLSRRDQVVSECVTIPLQLRAVGTAEGLTFASRPWKANRWEGCYDDRKSRPECERLCHGQKPSGAILLLKPGRTSRGSLCFCASRCHSRPPGN